MISMSTCGSFIAIIKNDFFARKYFVRFEERFTESGNLIVAKIMPSSTNVAPYIFNYSVLNTRRSGEIKQS